MKTLRLSIAGAVLTCLFSLAYADGKKPLTAEDLARAFNNEVLKADIIVVGTLSEIRVRRFEVSFHGEGGRTQVNSFDSGTLKIKKLLKGKLESDATVAFQSEHKPFPYWGTEKGKPRIWLLQSKKEPTAGFHILLAQSYPVEDEQKFMDSIRSGKKD